MKTNSPAEAFTLKIIGAFALAGGGAFALHAIRTLPGFHPAAGQDLLGNQLWGLGEMLCLYFVLLPLIAVAGGSFRSSVSGPFSGRTGGFLLMIGGVLLVPALISGRMEHGWMFAMAYAGEAWRVSPWQMGGILFAGLGVMWMMLRQIHVSLTLWREHRRLADFLFVCAPGLVAVGMPLTASTAFYALKLELLDFAIVDAGSGISLWMGGIPYAAALGMFHTAALMTIFGMLLRQAAPDYRSGRWTTLCVGAIPVLGLLAPELRVVPLHLPDLLVLSAMFMHSLLLAVWWVAIWRVLVEIQSEKGVHFSPLWFVAGGLLALGISLSLIMNLLIFSGLHLLGGWVFLQRVAIGGGVVLACWMSLMPFRMKPAAG